MIKQHLMEIQIWSIDRLVFYARNPRKNDAAVDRMCSSIREFGFKVPVLARSDGEVVDGHLRLKAARKLRITEVPVVLCDEWSPAQVKAFRLMVNRSVAWAQWDEELLALELQELNEADFDLSLTGFDPKEIDDLLAAPEDDDKANAAPPLPENPVSRPGDLWLCGKHRVLCGDATSAETVAQLLGDRKPSLLVTNDASPGIYGVRADGASEPQRLMEGRPGGLPYSFSPDGKWLAGSADDGIWIAPVQEGHDGLQLGKSQPFLRGSGDTYAPRFSPDGHWLAYMSAEGGPMAVFVRPFPRPQPNGGGKWQISNGNGGTPIWSRNGRELFFRGEGIMVVDYTAKGDTFIPGQPRRWSDRHLQATGGLTLFDVAPDGKHIAAVTQEEDAGEQKPITHLAFIENIFDELRRRVPAGGK